MIIEFFGPFVFYFPLVVLTVRYLNKHGVTLQHWGHFIISWANNVTVVHSLIFASQDCCHVYVQNDICSEAIFSGGSSVFQVVWHVVYFNCWTLMRNGRISKSDKIHNFKKCGRQWHQYPFIIAAGPVDEELYRCVPSAGTFWSMRLGDAYLQLLL